MSLGQNGKLGRPGQAVNGSVLLTTPKIKPGGHKFFCSISMH